MKMIQNTLKIAIVLTVLQLLPVSYVSKPSLAAEPVKNEEAAPTPAVPTAEEKNARVYCDMSKQTGQDSWYGPKGSCCDCRTDIFLDDGFSPPVTYRTDCEEYHEGRCEDVAE